MLQLSSRRRSNGWTCGQLGDSESHFSWNLTSPIPLTAKVTRNIDTS
jgi:hypothetical protein